MRKKILLAIVAILLVGSVVTYLLMRAEPADTRFSGAYLLEDGTPVLISPREGKVLRYRLMNGESAALWPTAQGQYEGGAGWAEREPVVNRIRFETDTNGRPTGFAWEQVSASASAQAASGQWTATRHARALHLPERIFTFSSGDLQLRGKLVLPAGEGPFPVVVLVHGSESDSAVDYYFEPYFYAANGFASLVFDKRGTGESEGEYLQNFHVLSDDVIAAVQWARTEPRIDPRRIHLAGFSQGGWIAPLAALKDGGIRSVLVCFGVMVPIKDEDRWGYVYSLRQRGFGEDAIAAADRINAVIEDILDRRLNRWGELAAMVDSARGEPWFDAVKDSESALGLVAGTKLPLWMIRIYAWWRMGEHRQPAFVDWRYDPVPTMNRLDIPSLWLLGGEDSSAPTEWTVGELKKLQAVGKPVEYLVYPNADHGILRYVQEKNGERRYLGYEPDYFPKQLQWLRGQSGP